MTEVQETPTSREKGRRSRRVVPAGVLLVLFLLGLALFWPVPEGARERDGAHVPSADERRGPAPLVGIVDASASIAGDVPLGRKAQALAISVTIDNRGDARAFDPNMLRLEVNQQTLVPLGEYRSGVAPVSRVPASIDEGVTEGITVVFAVPAESTEATVVLFPGDIRPDAASRVAVTVPEQEVER